MTGWMTQARANAPIPNVATELGLLVSANGGIGPCPNCKAEVRESGGRRLPIGTSGGGWKCHRCGSKGSVIDLVALQLGQGPKSADVRAWFAGRAWCDGKRPDAPPKVQKPTKKVPFSPEEIETFWQASTPIAEDEAASAWLAQRGIDPDIVTERDLARVIPKRPPVWARKWRGRDLTAAFRLFDSSGTARNIRVRRTHGDGPKMRTPYLRPTKGLVGANEAGRAMLRTGTLAEGAVVYLTEGESDFLTLSLWLSEASPDVVLSVGSGQWTADHALRIPDGTQVFVCTDPDVNGVRYAKGVASSLGGRCPIRIPDPSAKDTRDLNDRWVQDGASAFDPVAGLVAYDDGKQGDGSSCCEETPDGRPYLVAVRGSSKGLYVATPSRYIFVDRAFVAVELERLWPDLRTCSDDGDPYSVAKLYSLYGRRADQLFWTYLGRTRFEAGPDNGGTLFLEVVHDDPPREVFHPDVDEWLRIAFNEQTLDWLATLPQLDRPTAILWLYGPKGLGKGMLAEACSRFFGHAVADYDDVFKSRFNDAMLRCPVIWLDEQAEVRTSSGVLRKRAGNSRHAIEAKHEASGTLLGCPRQVWTSNNEDPANLGRETPDLYSNEAIGDRIVIVECDRSAEAWLKERGGRGFTAEWIQKKNGDPGFLVEHIAWLANNRRVVPGTRFLVTGDAAEWTARSARRPGLPRTILDAVAAYLEMAPLDRQWVDDRHAPFRFHPNHAGQILVSVSGLIHHWRHLVGHGEPTPSSLEAGKAMQLLSGNSKTVRPRFGGSERRPPLYALDLSRVEEHLDS